MNKYEYYYTIHRERRAPAGYVYDTLPSIADDYLNDERLNPIPSTPSHNSSLVGYAIYNINIYAHNISSGSKYVVASIPVIGGLHCTYRAYTTSYTWLYSRAGTSNTYIATESFNPPNTHTADGMQSQCMNDIANNITSNNTQVNTLNPKLNIMNTMHYYSLSTVSGLNRLYDNIPMRSNWALGRSTTTYRDTSNGDNTLNISFNTPPPMPPAFKLLYKDPQCRYIVFAALKSNTTSIDSATSSSNNNAASIYNTNDPFLQEPGIYVTETKGDENAINNTYMLHAFTKTEYIKYTTSIRLGDKIHIEPIHVIGKPDVDKFPYGIGITIDATAYWYRDYRLESYNIGNEGNILNIYYRQAYISCLHNACVGNYTYINIYFPASNIIKQAYYDIEACEIINWPDNCKTYLTDFRFFKNREKEYYSYHVVNTDIASHYLRPENQDNYIFNKCFDYNNNLYTLSADSTTKLIEFKINNIIMYREKCPVLFDAITHLHGCYIQEDNVVLLLAFNVRCTGSVTSANRVTSVYQLRYFLDTGEINSCFPDDPVDEITDLGFTRPVIADIASSRAINGTSSTSGDGFRYGVGSAFLSFATLYIGCSKPLFEPKLKFDINNNWDSIIIPQTMICYNNVHQAYFIITEKRPFYIKDVDDIYIKFMLSRLDQSDSDQYDVIIEYLREGTVIWRLQQILPNGEHKQSIDDGHFLPEVGYNLSMLISGGVYDFKITAKLLEPV